jgi:sugar O-acyltransferase (sialic acid O-acetyltransferase NeuD family)
VAETKLFICWGASGHAQVLTELVATLNGTVVAYFDRDVRPPIIDAIPVYVGLQGFEQWASSFGDLSRVSGVVAIGHCGPDRENLLALLRSHGVQTPTLISPNASVSTTSNIGQGTQILPHALVAAKAEIGAACIINHGAVVEHECILDAGVHVAPRATLCGCVKVGSNVFVGAGSVILPRVEIGDNATIGAGAVVTRNVPAGATVIGNPAYIMKEKQA